MTPATRSTSNSRAGGPGSALSLPLCQSRCDNQHWFPYVWWPVALIRRKGSIAPPDPPVSAGSDLPSETYPVALSYVLLVCALPAAAPSPPAFSLRCVWLRPAQPGRSGASCTSFPDGVRLCRIRPATVRSTHARHASGNCGCVHRAPAFVEGVVRALHIDTAVLDPASVCHLSRRLAPGPDAFLPTRRPSLLQSVAPRLARSGSPLWPEQRLSSFGWSGPFCIAAHRCRWYLIGGPV